MPDYPAIGHVAVTVTDLPRGTTWYRLRGPFRARSPGRPARRAQGRSRRHRRAALGSGTSFRDPDGIALEFFAPPS